FSALADGDLGYMGVLRGFGASYLTAGGWLLPVAGALLLSGCIPGPFVRPDSDSCPCAPSVTANSETSSDQPKSEQAQPPEKSNKPRTLPQAVCAYLHCLRTHGWEAQDQKENEESADEKKGNKSPTKGQELGESSNEKKDGNQDQPEEKKDSKEGDKKEEEKKEEEKKEEEKQSWFSANAQTT